MTYEGEFEVYHNYFKNFSENDPELEFFMYGGIEKGYEYASNDPEFKYPFLWLEEPKIEIYFNGGSQWIARYIGGTNCTLTVDETNKEEIVQALNQSQRILFRLIKKLVDSHKNYEFIKLNQKFDLTEVDPGWALNHRGWRLDLDIELDVSLLINNS